ncbi:uncharacterized protein LOC131953101 [Physella acuta]|uniref:uncharacterized protein LOC131953101 n=1 Tax=Physella acuta TaxID=109671 RepID=UPI0027DC6357|nr:uncharacterized protein LOC131953101 [Physella acuta]
MTHHVVLTLVLSLACGLADVRACPADAVTLACNILAKHNSGKVVLATAHFSRITDNAFALNNIRDMCNGKEASRSSYSCSECKTKPAPGGTVCISSKVLTYLSNLIDKGTVKVNEIAGACHSCTSKHYSGTAIDLDDGPRDAEYMTACRNIGGVAIDEGNHIHCQF